MLEIKDLKIQYGDNPPVLEHFDLSMKRGEIIGIVGESGSGKTTGDQGGFRRPAVRRAASPAAASSLTEKTSATSAWQNGESCEARRYL